MRGCPTIDCNSIDSVAKVLVSFHSTIMEKAENVIKRERAARVWKISLLSTGTVQKSKKQQYEMYWANGRVTLYQISFWFYRLFSSRSPLRLM